MAAITPESNTYTSKRAEYSNEIEEKEELKKRLENRIIFKKAYKKNNCTVLTGTNLQLGSEGLVIVFVTDPYAFFDDLSFGSLQGFRFTKKVQDNLINLGHHAQIIDNRSVHFISVDDIVDSITYIHQIDKYLEKVFFDFIDNTQRKKFEVYIHLIKNDSNRISLNQCFGLIMPPIERSFGNEKFQSNIMLSIPNNVTRPELGRVIDYFEKNWVLKDKIDFSIDDPTLEDKLGRKPIAINLAKLIHNDIIGSEKCHAFMAHLQGRWGEGKTSFMKFLEEGLQTAGNHRWIIVHYNAWKNQHVNPPWWTFIEILYHQGRSQLGRRPYFLPRILPSIREFIRRLNVSALFSLFISALAILIIFLIINYTETQIDFFEKKINQIISSLVILGSIFGIGHAWSRFFILNTPENAQLFMKRSENPNLQIKKHFEALVNDLIQKGFFSKPKNNIAIFIDDLDRCNAEYVVSLLEGIQTMFNDQKVFYLIAADKHWIAKSFEIVYEKYVDTARKGTKLGYSFIEKNFQLSIRLPNPSDDNIAQYWKYLLKHEDVKSTNEEDKTSNTDGLENELNDISDVQDLVTGKFNAIELSKKYGTDLVETQTRILERINKVDTSFAHILSKHHPLVGTNPRAVKRLANQYTTYRDILIVEQSEVEPIKLFRWVILQNRWPLFTDELEQIPSLVKNPDEALKDLGMEFEKVEIKNVIGTGDTRLTQQDVEKFIGTANRINNA